MDGRTRALVVAASVAGCTSPAASTGTDDVAGSTSARPDATSAGGESSATTDAPPSSTETTGTTTAENSSTVAETTTTPEASSDESTVGLPCPLPAATNVVTYEGSMLALARASDDDLFGIAFARNGDEVTAVSARGEELWTQILGAGAHTSGFDFDDDGVPDLAIARREITGVCGADPSGASWLDFYKGADGSLAYSTPQEADICWTFGSITYPTIQWTAGAVNFGAGPDLFVSATYAATSTFLHWDGATMQSSVAVFPSTPQFGATYPSAQPNAYGQGVQHVENAHIANGLMLEVEGEERVAFFTSARVSQYANAPQGATQLRADAPYLTGGRTDIAGRNYGLVVSDPASPERIWLLSGTSAYGLQVDALAGAMSWDPWGQIERHLTLYDASTNVVTDRFYSYAHDANDGHQYQHRLAYPAQPLVPDPNGGPSRLAYNTYSDGHWILHLTDDAGVADAATWRGVYLWDIRDLDGDGSPELVTTATEDPEDPDVPGYYFPKWRTSLQHLDIASATLTEHATFEGRLPAFAAGFSTATHRSSMTYLYPASIVAVDCEPQLVLSASDGTPENVPVP